MQYGRSHDSQLELNTYNIYNIYLCEVYTCIFKSSIWDIMLGCMFFWACLPTFHANPACEAPWMTLMNECSWIPSHNTLTRACIIYVRWYTRVCKLDSIQWHVWVPITRFVRANCRRLIIIITHLRELYYKNATQLNRLKRVPIHAK